MSVIIDPATGEPFSNLTVETRLQRKNTHWFILADPSTLQLTPSAETVLPSGGVGTANGEPRPVQTFRIIPMSHTERPRGSLTGTAGSSSGVQRRHDLTLLGEWDALFEPGDWWQDERGEKWIVDEMVPHNGYETRGLVTAYGRAR